MNAPATLYIELNRRCNLGCGHCDFWKSQLRTVLSREQREQIMEEFAELGGKYVVTCGGEIMLDEEDFFHLHRTVRGLGMTGRSVVNGTRVHVGTVERMIKEGPAEVTVSLDSANPDRHDEYRGQKGAWQSAVRAISLLLETRRRSHAKTKVYAMVIVSERNYRELPRMFEFVLKELGADKLKLNIVQPAFGARNHDPFFEAEYIHDPDDLLRTIAEADMVYGIARNPKWMQDVRMYCESVLKDDNRHRGWRSPGRTDEVICNSCERNIMIDTRGVGRLCFSGAFPGKRIKEPGDLTALWQDADWRDDMRKCKRYCGISHSVRESTSTLAAA